MRTTGPTARTTLAVRDVIGQSLNMIGARLGFLHRSRPTNPFVARQECEIIPSQSHFLRRGKRRAHIARHSMRHPGCECFGHETILPDYLSRFLPRKDLGRIRSNA